MGCEEKNTIAESTKNILDYLEKTENGITHWKDKYGNMHTCDMGYVYDFLESLLWVEESASNPDEIKVGDKVRCKQGYSGKICHMTRRPNGESLVEIMLDDDECVFVEIWEIAKEENRVPSACVPNIVHAKWIIDEEGYGTRKAHCSHCGKRSSENSYTSQEQGCHIDCCYAILTDYCPNCGAKMDLRTD